MHIEFGSVNWDWLASAMHFARIFKMDMVLRSFPMKSLGAMQWLRDARTEQDNPASVPLFDLLEETSVFASALPGDKLYRVMSLADQSVSIPVDYALSGEEIFTRLAIEFLENRQSLDILSHCMLPATQSKLKLPSWVPD